MSSDGIVAEVPWVINPFRGDKFEAAWLPVAEAALDYGATGWSLFRSKEGGLDFTQLAFFPAKLDFERYWYSDEVGKAREQIAGWYHVPLVPVFHSISGMGSLAPAASSS
jgi:hypothetical protein